MTSPLSILVELGHRVEAEGVGRLSPQEFIDAANIMRSVGLESKQSLKLALSLLWVKKRSEQQAFNRGFEVFFSTERKPLDVFCRLENQGFKKDHIGALRDWVANRRDAKNLHTWLSAEQPQAEWLTLLRSFGSEYDTASIGALASRIQARLGWSTIDSVFEDIKRYLDGQYGAEGLALGRAFENALLLRKGELRAFVERRMHETTTTQIVLQDRNVEQQILSLISHLRERLRVRMRHQRKGSVNFKATLTASAKTLGVPMELVRKRKRIKPSKWMIVCDVSDSVRALSQFFLSAVAAFQRVMPHTEVFLFTNQLMRINQSTRVAGSDAFAVAINQARAHLGGNSNYSRVLLDLCERSKHWSPNTNLVIVGDARNNWHAPSEHALRDIQRRVEKLFWWNPEAPSQWTRGDSVMQRYQGFCSAVFAVYDIETFRAAVQKIADEVS